MKILAKSSTNILWGQLYFAYFADLKNNNSTHDQKIAITIIRNVQCENAGKSLHVGYNFICFSITAVRIVAGVAAGGVIGVWYSIFSPPPPGTAWKVHIGPDGFEASAQNTVSCPDRYLRKNK